MELGKAKYSSGRNTFTTKKGENNVYRILPPMGSLAKSGTWRTYVAVQWGFKGSDGRMKPFQDCRVVNHKTKMIEVESAAYLFRSQLEANYADTVAAFKAGNASQDQVRQAKELKERFNLEARHYVNAVNLEGEIGLLKLNTTQKNALMQAIETQRNQGIDPLSVDKGVFFNFTKSNSTGKIQDWVFGVAPYQENVRAVIDGVETLVQKTKYHRMDEDFIGRLSAEAYDLSNLYPTPTPEEIARIVEEGELAVDEILGNASSKDSSAPVAATASTPVAAQAPVQTAAAPTPAPVTATPAPAPVAQTAPAEASSGEGQTDDEFLASLGIQ